jgi:hypothetical protein
MNSAQLLAQSHELAEFDSGKLSDIYKQSWSVMCAYTHTGSQQVLRWSSNEAIQPDYSDAEVNEVLSFTGALALLSTLGIAVIASNELLANSALAKAQEFGCKV